MGYNKSILKKMPEGHSSKGIPLRIMVVDDDAISRKIIIQMIKSLGYVLAAEAVDGLDAVQAYRMHRPDLVTMDLQMPKMDGFTALKEIIKFDKDASVVMLTATSNISVVKKILESGAKGYVMKPINRDALVVRLRAVRKLMGR